MRRSLHPTARKGRETRWEMMRLWGEESRKLKAGGRRKVKHCQAAVGCVVSHVFMRRGPNTNRRLSFKGGHMGRLLGEKTNRFGF